jgi:hypothetical protein
MIAVYLIGRKKLAKLDCPFVNSVPRIIYADSAVNGRGADIINYRVFSVSQNGSGFEHIVAFDCPVFGITTYRTNFKIIFGTV